MTRERVQESKRLVVKIGTSSLTDADGRLERGLVQQFVEEVCDVLEGGREVVCVSSGAIAAGLGPLGFKRRPADMPSLQAAASVGQSHLMHAYATGFEARGRACGQVLLTRHDFVHRQQYVNALNTFRRLLSLGAVPVVNENDTVGTDEIRFGENDFLAALVANIVQADLLVLLSDVDGLHRGRGGPVVEEVEAITPEVEALAGGSASALATGGMRSKVAAARVATSSGIPVVVARSGRGRLGEILAGAGVGTLFHPAPAKLASRKAWIAFATVPRGKVVVDDGARHALTAGNRSLLAAGVKGVEGLFSPGDVIEITDEQGRAFARGLVAFSSEELRRIAGFGSKEIGELMGGVAREVVHRDELVVL